MLISHNSYKMLGRDVTIASYTARLQRSSTGCSSGGHKDSLEWELCACNPPVWPANPRAPLQKDRQQTLTTKPNNSRDWRRSLKRMRPWGILTLHVIQSCSQKRTGLIFLQLYGQNWRSVISVKWMLTKAEHLCIQTERKDLAFVHECKKFPIFFFYGKSVFVRKLTITYLLWLPKWPGKAPSPHDYMDFFFCYEFMICRLGGIWQVQT